MTVAPMATLDAWVAVRLGLAGPLDRGRLEAAQLARLNATIAHARVHSPFYRRRAAELAAPLASLDDLARLPFTTPEDLARGDPPFLTVSQGMVERVVTLPTSGSRGAPKRIGFTAEDREATLDFFAHGLGLFTAASDRVAILFAGERPASVGATLTEAVARLGATALAIPAAASAEEVAGILREGRATVAAGPPVRLLAAARVSLADGGTPIRLRAVLTSSEPAAASLRRGLAAAWGAEVHDHWGMTETGWGGAVDCAAHGGLHLREADLLIEVVDPRSGERLADGVEGEIVVTTLSRRATPLVRYRTGDRGHLVAGPCACGSVLRRLEPTGRLDDGAMGDAGATPTLARLDAVLFDLPQICDVAAALTPGAPAALRLTLGVPAPWRSKAVIAAARAALTADPAIGPMLAAGRLTLAIELAAGATCGHDGKRCLTIEPAR
ncbi:phenylacetate--CoA ligase family protein [Siculibacillus lacustris]|uniref:Phenylacetate--CoA ligase family protein n=1 Tax=Siculibacillus lacustris TaxID=1549641 RepID=A0A4Q9VKZ2_9HYPH|nr:AMP-binding protein [Siculibacillus lacustris]TBW36122.1 phenylacetate--CoA ligase family protein [Siculibacillus lacustris]